MTTKFGIATFAAVSSAVLIFGSTAHAEGPNFLSYSPKLSTTQPLPTLEPLPLAPSVPTPPVPPLEQVPLKQAPKFEKLQELAAIATETKAPAVIQHPVTDPSNTYVWGQCTWYVKNKRPDLPNGLGNGGQWVAHAAALGYATGSTPRAGAVGEETGHVVYIESVNGDGTVNISEMNYAGGVGVVHTRTVAASTFTYIY